MFKWFNLKRTPLIGLDISSSSVKVLEISKFARGAGAGPGAGAESAPPHSLSRESLSTDTSGTSKAKSKITSADLYLSDIQMGGTYNIEHCSIEPLPPNSIVDHQIQDADAVANTIRRAVTKSGTSLKHVAISVSGSAVMSRIIQMGGDFTDQEISEQIELEAERYFPFPIEEVYYDFEVLGPSPKNPELIDVLLGVARIEAVEAKLQVVRQAGLKPTMVDIDSVATERAYTLITRNLSTEDREGKIALMDIGANITTFYVFQGHSIIYNREQVFGGKQIIDEIQRRYGLTHEEALAQTKYGQLPEDYTQEVLVPFREAVVQQATRAVQTFISSVENPELKYLFIAGGVASLPGLESLLQNNLNIKTMIANPLADMHSAPNINRNELMDEAPSLMVCTGLALRTFEE